ncbi:MAG: flagellar basal body protein [Solidesulfovibrio sp.]
MGALWAGVSGLLSYSQGIAVTANNLANSNTVGFKSSRTLFADMLSEIASGTSDGSQVGTGSNLSRHSWRLRESRRSSLQRERAST